MNRLSILLVCILLLAAAVCAQEQSGVILTGNGALVVWNEPGNNYTIEVKAKKIEPIPNKMLALMVNGKYFEIATPKKDQFVKDENDDRAILLAQMKWEADYISSTIKKEIKPTSKWLKLSNGTEAHFWSYDMPKLAEDQTVVRQLHVSVVKGDHVLMVYSPLERGEDENAVLKFLTDTLTTLKPSTKPLSLQKASEMVKAGNYQ